jgi:hypothetical protein
MGAAGVHSAGMLTVESYNHIATMAATRTCSTVAPKLCRGVGELSDLSSAHVPALGSYSMGCSILAICGAGQARAWLVSTGSAECRETVDMHGSPSSPGVLCLSGWQALYFAAAGACLSRGSSAAVQAHMHGACLPYSGSLHQRPSAIARAAAARAPCSLQDALPPPSPHAQRSAHL